MKNIKPRVFIGSSKESLNIAHALQANLEHKVEATIWCQRVFKPSQSNLEALLERLDNSDFGIFVFSGDDIVRIRGQEHQSVRDNIVFELGLFIGRLGKGRNFLVLPREQENFRIPTDLLELTPVTFSQDRRDHNMVASLGPACDSICERIDSLFGPEDVWRRVGAGLGQQVVKTLEASVSEWYWIDVDGTVYKLLDKETAEFLAKDKNVLAIEPSVLAQLKRAEATKPSIKEADVRRQSNNYFILYNGRLCYQSGLEYIYKLLAWKNIPFEGKKLEDLPLRELTQDEFIKYPKGCDG